MNKVPENIIFNVSGCLTQDAIHKYIAGGLPAGDARRLELHLSDCPLCSDAVEGYMATDARTDVNALLADARTELFSSRMPKLSVIKNKAPEKKRSNRVLYFSLAASIALLITGYFVIRTLVDTTYIGKEMALREDAPGKKSKSVTDETLNEEFNGQKDANADMQKSGEEKPSLQDILQIIGDRDEAEKTTENSVSATGTGYWTVPMINDVSLTKDYRTIADSIVPLGGTVAEAKKDADLRFVPGAANKQEELLKTNSFSNGIIIADGAKEKADDKVELQAVTISQSKISRGAAKKEGKAGAAKVVTDVEAMPYSAGREEINTGITEYNQGNYPAAIDRFEQTLKRDQNDLQSLYYCGMAYYYNKQYDKALSTLEKILKFKNSTYFQSAKWQISQIYLETSQPKEARKVLNEIIDEGGTYKKDAIDAVDKLEKK
jgi:tetratricopeptide (TPR) repeat protein